MSGTTVAWQRRKAEYQPTKMHDVPKEEALKLRTLQALIRMGRKIIHNP